MESAAEAARNAKETLELAFQMSNILETGLDRHTLSLLIALCDRGVNPEALAALLGPLASTPRSRSLQHCFCHLRDLRILVQIGYHEEIREKGRS
ncbi:hypothetical protein OPV22_033314 [Ensete ventricosum]|uniref:Mitotic-spindle organizing protein 1 n=1 Tax=Ensete ventricosum TaxID=4639 RepID=A0AAV8PTU5_ENSVE|nr:hypothetical protein OPV22_033314 [Ensete ventricosum]